MIKKHIDLDEIIDNVDGLQIATEAFISKYLKDDINTHEVLSIISEELDKISSKLEVYKIKKSTPMVKKMTQEELEKKEPLETPTFFSTQRD